MNNKKLLWILFVLAVTQVIGWGTISLPAVIGDQLARDIGLSLPLVFAGSTTMLVVTGIAALSLSNAFVVYGARVLMAAGSVVAAFGFLLLAYASGPMAYFLSWVILGISGAATLSTASYVFLNEMAGAAAKRPISALMLVTGLSSSIFWPITAALTANWGWRPTMLIYAALMLFVCFPLYVFGLPARHTLAAERPTDARATRPAMAPGKVVFLLLASAVTINGFVSWGFSSIVIQLLRTMGTADARAIQLGSLLGVMQVSARALDYVGGARWDGLTTGLIAASVLPISFLLLMIGGPAEYAVLGFLALYGMANGIMTVGARHHAAGVLRSSRLRARRLAHRISAESGFGGSTTDPGLRADAVWRQRRADDRRGYHARITRAARHADLHPSQGGGTPERSGLELFSSCSCLTAARPRGSGDPALATRARLLIASGFPLSRE